MRDAPLSKGYTVSPEVSQSLADGLTAAFLAWLRSPEGPSVPQAQAIMRYLEMNQIEVLPVPGSKAGQLVSEAQDRLPFKNTGT